MHTFTVSDMRCGSCAAAITRAIQQADADAVVQADPASKRVMVESRKSAQEIAKAIAAAGYQVAD